MEPLELPTLVEKSGGSWIASGPPPPVRVAELGTDSRAIAGPSVFVALKGPRFDGHDHVEEARRKGAVASIVERGRLPALPRGGGPFIAVDDPLESFERIARWNRDRLGLSVVAVTGSVGKTSTKEFLATVLAGAFRVKSAPKSFNNRIGVATTLLSAGPDTEVLVVELGTSGPGEISHLSRLVRPHRVVVTEIAPAHLHGLGDLAGVVAAKAEVFDGLVPGGSAFVRHNIEGFEVFSGRRKGPLVTFGMGEGDYAVTSCQRVALGHDGRAGVADYGYLFTLNAAENLLLPVPGRHNVLNAAAAIAVARDLGMGWHDIRSLLATCRLPPLRLQVFEEGGVTIVDDTYNANPRSMEAAIGEWEELVAAGRDGRLEAGDGGEPRGVAVLGDMLEMGQGSRALHEELGRRLARAPGRLIVTVGSDSRWIAEALRESGSRAETSHLAGAAEVVPLLRSRLLPGDVALFKASRGIGLDGAVRELRSWLRGTKPSGESP
ncbi:MAG: UDP-N-acetylmuramoyl-tripeptide--D-alanyl-D-alanine ligase [Planctomycetes bacterium]|nr:UDP-N-acetylmuramoyl-tripeptide--D-alanyl-D-alanine ligase [Planctomycetota bacterium]